MASSGLKRRACQTYSSAAMPARAQAGSHSMASSCARPSVRATSNKPQAEYRRRVRNGQLHAHHDEQTNGSSEERAGIWACASPKIFAIRSSAGGSLSPSLRTNQRLAAKKNTAKPPMTNRSDGANTTAVTGSLKMLRPVASRVSTSVAATAVRDALITARAMAMRTTDGLPGPRQCRCFGSRALTASTKLPK